MHAMVVNENKEKNKERKQRHSHVRQGYLMERQRTASMITEEDEDLPLFDEVMSLALSASEGMNLEVGKKGERVAERKKAERKEVERKEEKDWAKSLTHKASYTIRRKGNF